MAGSASDTLRIGLLQCGHVHPDLVRDFGDYPELFRLLLAGRGVDLVTHDVTTGALPRSPADCDGWLVSGSGDSVYDPLPWIGGLEHFLLDTVEAGVPLVAVCFGHQLLARALGAPVGRADSGWGVGAHDYELVDPPEAWTTPPLASVRLIASHQDQVGALPDGARLVARSAHCPIAAFTLGPRTLALQPHPEFPADLSRRLTALRRDQIGLDRADAALTSLDRPLDADVVAGWMTHVWRR